MGKNKEKTNVMRILDQKKIAYESYSYVDTGAVSGIEVAEVLGENPDMVFKTLVTVGKSKTNYVFVIPVNCELDLKKAAHAVKEKSVEMLKSKELLPLTGYVHGGCSPIGMKKQFTTVIHKTAKNFETMIFSGGKIGYQVELSLEDLLKSHSGKAGGCDGIKRQSKEKTGSEQGGERAMMRYTWKRILTGIVSLFLLATVTFFLVRLIPGSPFQRGGVSEQVVEAVEEEYGLNDPLIRAVSVIYGKSFKRRSGDFLSGSRVHRWKRLSDGQLRLRCRSDFRH